MKNLSVPQQTVRWSATIAYLASHAPAVRSALTETWRSATIAGSARVAFTAHPVLTVLRSKSTRALHHQVRHPTTASGVSGRPGDLAANHVACLAPPPGVEHELAIMKTGDKWDLVD